MSLGTMFIIYFLYVVLLVIVLTYLLIGQYKHDRKQKKKKIAGSK